MLFAAVLLILRGADAQMTPSSTVGAISATTSLPPGITLAPTHAPFPPPNIAVLPSDFSDIPASVVSCWDAHANYTTSSEFLVGQIWSAVQSSESVYPPGHVSLSTYINEYFNCNTTAIPAYTTLCDGYSRASALSTNCLTKLETATYSFAATDYWFTPSWSTELEQLPTPTCTVAADFGPVCSRLKDAYSWRVSDLKAQPSASGTIVAPGCRILIPPAPSAKPSCYLEGGTWDAWYWPTPTPSGDAFCGTNGTNMTATPTMPAQVKTAVVSGITLTSPSVYHFLRNATLHVFAGRILDVDDPSSIGQESYAPSTTASLLTVKQFEADILTVSQGCAGSGRRRYCTKRVSLGFSIPDLATARASEYCQPYECREFETIVQEDYTPTAALAMTDVVAQNGVFMDCAWTTPGSRMRTAGPPAWQGPVMRQSDWHQITATDAGAQVTPAP